MPQIAVDQVQAGMVLAAEVHDRRGRMLIPSGRALDAKHVRALKMWGITRVEVERGDAQGVARGVLATADRRAEVQTVLQRARRDKTLVRPVRRGHAVPFLASEAAAAELHPPTVESRRHGRILLAEDDPVNALVGRLMLQRLGHEVETVPNGRRAIEALELGTFDMVLMDWHMPEMDGFQATAVIRARGNWPTLPIIALTGGAMAGDREKCIEAGMNDYLTKPIDLTELARTVDRWLATAEGLQIAPVVEAPAPGTAFDAEGALDRVGSVELLSELIDLFLSQWFELRQVIEGEMQSGNASSLAMVLHRIRGGAGNVGAPTVAKVSGELERLAGGGELEAVKSGIGQLDEAHVTFKAEVGDWQKGRVA